MSERFMESRTPEPTGGPDCAWCGGVFESIIELLDHVDGEHLPAVAAQAAESTLPGLLRLDRRH